MDKKLNSVFIISSVGLLVSALIFVSVAVFGDIEYKWMLYVALFCCVLGNLLNLIRTMIFKSK